MEKGYSTVIFILLFLIVVFVVVMGFYLGGMTNNYYQRANLDNLTATPSPSVSDLADPKLCAQVITPAKNSVTGECKEFSTPCEVQEGWEKVGSCLLTEQDLDLVDDVSKKYYYSPNSQIKVISLSRGDSTILQIKQSEEIIVYDLVNSNYSEIGMGVKYKCQCGITFDRWINNEEFAIKIVNGLGEEYQFLVDALKGKVKEESFKRLK